MTKVKVIDAICGAGKSTHIMKHMREHKDERWIYASPYLTEVGDGRTEGRIQKALPEMEFISPDGSKGKHLKELISSGSNVAITHALLMQLDKECLTLIQAGGYNLVIDETLDVVSTYKRIPRDDLRGLVGNYVILNPTTNRLSWNTSTYGDDYSGMFKDIKDMCDLESLYLHKETVLINKLSNQVVRSAKSVTVLTYLFEGSFMQAWLDIANIEWEYEKLDSGIDPEVIKQKVRDNLIIETTKKLDALNYPKGLYLRSAYSSSWYNSNPELMEEIRQGCENYLSKLRRKIDKRQVFWTTFKKYAEELKGRGYTRGATLSSDGEILTPFVTKNKRASNEYADSNICMYLVNVFPHGDITSYLQSQGYTIDADKFAISEMVQFIFRGSIRKDEPMHLLVASRRMETLLKEWLDSPF